MIQKRKIGFIIAAACFLITTAGFASDHSVMKKESDGRVSKENFIKHHEWMFDQNDTNKDGYLDTDEMKSLHKMVKKMHEHSEHQEHK